MNLNHLSLWETFLFWEAESYKVLTFFSIPFEMCSC